MKLIRVTAVAASLIFFFATWGIAQNTSPVPTTFEVRAPTIDEVTELTGDIIGDADAVTLEVPRADTVATFNLIFEVTGVDSPWVYFNYTTVYDGQGQPARSDTALSHEQIYLPHRGIPGSVAGMPDSLLSLRINSTQVVGNILRVRRRALPRGSPYWLELEFPTDSIKGTAQDTSNAYQLEGGIEEALFSFYSDFATPEITYFVDYFTGLGWGALNPLDTLAGKTWTDDVAAGGARHKHLQSRPDWKIYPRDPQGRGCR